MNFNDNKAIYLQIAEWVFEQILNGKWKEGDRIMSVRELGTLLVVNPNTILRSYDQLQKMEVIVNRRGVGYFVAPDATDKIISYRRKQFVEKDVPAFFKTMKLVRMSWEELEGLYKKS
ncbi:MAG: GntR family transcriptional regulator [Bacteroidales bacterium]|nr:GntR family transcriptional regulator [Bacteroidales bacterium]